MNEQYPRQHIKRPSRRKFLSTLSQLGMLGMSAPGVATTALNITTTLMDKSFKILFQGDSITDGNRGRTSDPNHIMGHGYAFSIASRLGADYPERHLTFINKGISGNTAADLLSRWQADALDLKPDVVSILVGVNDVLFLMKDHTGSLPLFATAFESLLEQTTTNLRGVLLVIGEPFIAPVGVVNEKLVLWKSEIELRQRVAKALAMKYNAVWIGYQEVFNKAFRNAPPEYWIWDGIHPTVPGHELMAREWIAQVGKELSIIMP